MTPRSEALAFRMWAYCEPREWDCTVSEVADALGVTPQRLGHIIREKRWTGRLRTESRISRFERFTDFGRNVGSFDGWMVQ